MSSLLFLGGNLIADEKKSDQPKSADAAASSKFQGTAIELKLKDDKASYVGELNDNDPVLAKHHYKIFTVQLEKGKIYRIDQHGSEPKFDAYLILENAEGTQVEADNNSGGELNARIVYKVAKTGAYRIIATTNPVQQTGKFTIEIGEPSVQEAKEAQMKYRVNNFAQLSGEQRKNLLQETMKRFQDKGEDLTVADARLALQIAIEAELEDLDLARDIYKDYIKIFSGASNKQVASVSKTLQSSMKNLDRLGKEITITGMTTDGKEFDLKNLKGKVVLVDFWATWCGPCIAEIPNMLKAHKKYHGKGFDIIGVSLDKTDAAIVKFNESRKLPWASINIADSRKLATKYGVNAIPHPILVGSDGCVVSFRARGPQLERLLGRLFSEK